MTYYAMFLFSFLIFVMVNILTPLLSGWADAVLSREG